jgi:hypothetical protein
MYALTITKIHTMPYHIHPPRNRDWRRNLAGKAMCRSVSASTPMHDDNFNSDAFFDTRSRKWGTPVAPMLCLQWAPDVPKQEGDKQRKRKRTRQREERNTPTYSIRRSGRVGQNWVMSRRVIWAQATRLTEWHQTNNKQTTSKAVNMCNCMEANSQHLWLAC